MNKHEYDLEYTNLANYFQARDNPAKYDLWWDRMKHLSITAFRKACTICIENGRYFPTLGEIKRLAYDNRLQSEIYTNEKDQLKISESEAAMGKELFPLFLDYLNKKTSRPEWIEQMKYFADKHGHGEVMRRSIHEHLG